MLFLIARLPGNKGCNFSYKKVKVSEIRAYYQGVATEGCGIPPRMEKKVFFTMEKYLVDKFC